MLILEFSMELICKKNADSKNLIVFLEKDSH